MAAPSITRIKSEAVWVDQTLPQPDQSFDEMGTTCYKSDRAERLEILKRAGGRKGSPEIVDINKRIVEYFKCQEYFLAIELLGDKPYWVLRWRDKESPRRPARLMPFNPQNPPFIQNDLVVFRVGDQKIRIVDYEYWQVVEMEEEKEPEQPVGGRALAVPINRHQASINKSDAVKGLADLILGKSVDDEPVGKLDVTKLDRAGALYQIDVMPASALNPQEEWDDTFVEKVMTTVKGQRSGVPESVEIIIAVDNSRSMEPGAALILRNLIDIVKALRVRGAQSVKIGVITFHDPNLIKTLLPLTEMDEQGISELLDRVGNIKFEGGREPAGKAVMAGLEALKSEGLAGKAVIAVTDDDGQGDDKIARPYYEDAKAEGQRREIYVELENIYEPERKEPLNHPLPVLAQIEKYNLNGNYSGLIGLATLTDSYFIRYHAWKVLKDLGLLVEGRIKRPMPRGAQKEDAERECADILCKVAQALANGEYSDEYLTTLNKIAGNLKDDLGNFASDYISYFLIHLVKDSERGQLEATAERLGEFYKSPENRGGVIFEPLHRFAFSMNNMSDFKKYYSLIKSIITRTNWSDAKLIVALLDDYAVGDHDFEDLRKYADLLIAHRSEMIREIAGRNRRLLPELVVNAPELNYYALLETDDAVRQMSNLVLETDRQHSWLQIKSGKMSAFINAVEGDGKIDSLAVEKIIQAVRSNPSYGGELTYYLIDPEMEVTRLTQRFISPENITQAFIILHRLKQRGISIDLRLVTPAGTYSMRAASGMMRVGPGGITRAINKVVDQYNSWMSRNNPLIEAEVVEGLESNGYMTVDYTYHHEVVTEVVKFFKKWIEIREELLRERETMRPSESLKFYSRLKEHYPRFKDAVEKLLKAPIQLPRIIPEFYKGMLRQELTYLKALQALQE